MAAPRPMIIISGTQDWTKNVAHEEYPAIRKLYELYGKPDNVANAVVNAPHNYNRVSREHVYEFLGQHVLGVHDPTALREKDEIQVERLQDMLALQNRACRRVRWIMQACSRRGGRRRRHRPRT